MSRPCDESLVQLYVDDQLARAERIVVGEHIRICPVCQARLVAYKSLFWDLAHPEQEAASLPQALLEAQADRLTLAWEQEVSARTPSRSPGRVAWDLSTVGLRASPVGEASASMLKWVLPAPRTDSGSGGGRLMRAGRSLVRLLGKGVKGR